MSIAIRDAIIVTQNPGREIIEGDVLVENGIIARVGEVKESADQEISADGDILIPGLINTHTHVSMALLKGVADDMSFDRFLQAVFEIDSRRDAGDISAGAKLGLLEMIMGGTTTFVDLYYSEDIIAKEVEESGLRGLLCWAVLDEEFTTQSGRPLDNCRRFHRDHAQSGRVIPGIGLQGVYVCSRETFLESRRYAEDNGLLLHFHLSETRKEVYEHKRKTGRRPAEWLEEMGFLSPRCLAAHAAWLTVNEIRALARNQVSISTCPVSNMKLATGGVAPIPEMREEGVVTSIGTDGSTTNNSLDMLGEMKALALLQKSNRWRPELLKAGEVLDMATVEAARAIGMGDQLGSIEVGKRADLVILDGSSPSMVPTTASNVVSNIVYSCSRADVKTTICDGRILMLDRDVLTIDPVETITGAREAARELIG